MVFRIAYENNPFKDNKIEDAKKKAYNIIKKQEAFPAFLCNWLIEKVQPMAAMEKVYINLNVGGKADSNFSFSVHEHFVYNFPRFAKALHGPKLENIDSSNSLPLSVPTSKSAKLNVKELGNLQLTKDILGSNRTNVSSKKVELSPSVVDFVTNEKEEATTKLASHKNDTTNNGSQSFVRSIPNSPSSKLPSGFGKDAIGSGLAPKKSWDRERDDDTAWRAFGQSYSSLSSQFRGKSESKVSLSMQRMNTTYNELIKQRYGKKRIW